MSDLFSSLLIFTIIKTILRTFFFTVSKFYKNLVKWALTEMECSVAGTTTLDREWYNRSNKVIMVRDTPPYGHAPTYQISLTYLERQKCYGPDKKIIFKKQLFASIYCWLDIRNILNFIGKICSKRICMQSCRYISQKNKISFL
jgi:hypothetical protein